MIATCNGHVVNGASLTVIEVGRHVKVFIAR